jgi:hypothetical protein
VQLGELCLWNTRLASGDIPVHALNEDLHHFGTGISNMLQAAQTRAPFGVVDCCVDELDQVYQSKNTSQHVPQTKNTSQHVPQLTNLESHSFSVLPHSYWEGIVLQGPQHGSCYAISSAQAQEGTKGVCESVESHCVPELPDPP